MKNLFLLNVDRLGMGHLAFRIRNFTLQRQGGGNLI